jgi:hypothetical protein
MFDIQFMMKFNENENDFDAEKQRQHHPNKSIHQLESKFDPRKFHGGNLTNYRQEILEQISNNQ